MFRACAQRDLTSQLERHPTRGCSSNGMRPKPLQVRTGEWLCALRRAPSSSACVSPERRPICRLLGHDMHITLVHNPSAGNTEVSGFELTRILNKAGHSVVYVPSTGADLDRALETATDLVVVAGGDGTVARVATQINRECRIAILPIGNANNIAKSLGAYGAFDKLISSWTAAAARPFHLIAAQGPWGSRRLVEGLGIGAITCALERMSGNKPSASLARDVIRRVLEMAAPHDLDMYLDAKNITGSFTILEVTTIALVGPNLLLARDANPSDKDLKLCALGYGEDQQHQFSTWLADAKRNDAPAPISILSGQQLTIRGRFQKVRLNDDIWSNEDVRDQEISLQTEVQPVYFLAPGDQTD